ncbi:MAG: bifunctional glutamate N-acetyltransferase/amino-acid acetyltransferase ArgJ [Chloroflexota bacterium]|nr:bifunctional glutamate N-acetyltransferase/amino-acid acetyltransferase ArgJ [Chloroflexota bacterium]
MSEVLTHIEGVPGFKVAGVHAGLKAEGKLDFALIVSEQPCIAAGVFTTNLVKAAPVIVDQERLAKKQTGYRAVAINTKCANACTGQQGIDNALQTARWVAERIGCAEDEVLVMSTGVIGTHLAMDKIKHGIALAADALAGGRTAWQNAAEAIMTTDMVSKSASAKAGDFSIAGITKGAGMIAPNMATMLGLIVTDAVMSAEALQAAATMTAQKGFNRIVVDGDMSTNDTVLLLTNGVSGKSPTASELAVLNGCIETVGIKLAKDIVRDGEGASKFITLQVFGADSDDAARVIANAIATSPLVKTAFYGGDANWGRIVAAAGRSGVAVNPAQMKLWIAGGEEQRTDLLLFQDGMPTAYDEARATAIMQEQSVYVTLDCGQGKGSAIVWTCDLTHSYVDINGHYRT